MQQAIEYIESVAVPPYFAESLPRMPVVSVYDYFMEPGALPLQYVKIPVDDFILQVYTGVTFTDATDLAELYQETAKSFKKTASVGFCFPGSSTVQVKRNNEHYSLPMSELQIGDQILVGGDEYERVYSFGHYQPNNAFKVPFLQIYTSISALTITPNHMVMLHEPSSSRVRFVPASQVQVGDKLIHGQTGEVHPVTRIRSKLMHNTGLYSPFTLSGKLVVDGVVVSSYMAFGDSEKLTVLNGYVAASWQWIAHTFQAPHRLACRPLSKCPTERYDSNGLSTWVARPFYAGQWLLRLDGNHWIVQHLVLILLLLVLGVMAILEQMMSCSVWLGAFIVTIIYCCCRKRKFA